ncbi:MULTISPECIES: GNAT family N-acetyltransferase [unclassified Streptomyces]|uniref:GNAT family N-acetyltransferase n=1 Tax=unclassified Streptomyces TaxID=2593676 RepID=UPI0024422AF1|nr:GNAT family N-acetyltransferase [Streptomyces sp. DH41]MDG9723395.1 GNAT family N-acetyltransferase [Streptomyces sp. DH41]
MTLDDCDRVSAIRVRGWRTAYRGLVPQPYLDRLDVSEDAERRRDLLTRAPDGMVNLVAEDDAGQVVGWACHGPYRSGEPRTADAELYALYVDAGRLGTGLGQALLGESVRRCAAAGHARMLLWVLEGNARARRFYERAGFHADGAEEPFEVDGVIVPEVRYSRALTG